MFLAAGLVLHLLTWIPQPAGGEVVKTFKIDRLTNCEPADQYPAVFLPAFAMISNAGVNIFNCTMRNSEEIDGPLKYVANIERCEMDLTKCEFFNTIEYADLCVYFSDVKFQREFLANVSPPLACPVQPADYQFTNNHWDMSPVVSLPGNGYRWKVTITIAQSATGRVVYCTKMMARIVVKRKKGNRAKP